MKYEILSETMDNNLHTKAIYLDNYPVVYVLNDSKKMYIGETTSIYKRMHTHMKDKEKKNLKKVNVITCEQFNKSAIYNIETNLINAFFADEKYEIINKKQINNIPTHDYYNKKYFDGELFEEIFEDLRTKLGLQNTLEQIKNKDIYKISPYKTLSYEQLDLRDEIMLRINEAFDKDEKQVYVIQGEAGTGKSVVISTLYKDIMDNAKNKQSKFYNTNNYLLINHPQMLKTYHNIASNISSMKKSNVLRPTTFINKIEEADITIVDEAHLLLSRSDTYNSYEGNNHLEDIINKSKFTIIVYDEKQYLKIKAYWDVLKLNQITKKVKTNTFVLRDQFRMNASNEIIKWIDDIVENKIVHKIDDITTDDFEFKIFEKAEDMYDLIKKRNDEFKLSRMVSTFDFVHKKGKDSPQCYVESGGFRQPWNNDYNKEKDAWAEIDETINEVGSTYTIQGFDLNYVGVIVGPSIKLKSSSGELEIDIDAFKDTEAFKFGKTLKNGNEIKEKIILNSLNVLMKRAVKGLYVHFTDESIYEYIRSK